MARNLPRMHLDSRELLCADVTVAMLSVGWGECPECPNWQYMVFWGSRKIWCASMPDYDFCPRRLRIGDGKNALLCTFLFRFFQSIQLSILWTKFIFHVFPTLTTFELCLVASLKNSAIEVIFILRIEHQPYDDPFAELSGNLRFWLKY